MIAQTSCPVLIRLPFAPPQGSSIDVATALNQLHFTYLSTVLLAIDHINERNGTIVPEFSSEDFARCNLNISKVMVQNTIPNSSSNDEITSTYLPGYEDFDECMDPIAAIGPLHGGARTNTSWQRVDIPNVLPSDFYWNNLTYYNSINTIPSYENGARPLLEYLNNTIHRDYIIFLHVNSTEGMRFINSIYFENKVYGLIIESFAFTLDDMFEETLRAALESIVKTRFTTIVFFPPLDFDYNPFVELINSFMLSAETFLWIVCDRIMGSFRHVATHLENLECRNFADTWINGLALFSPMKDFRIEFMQALSLLDDRMVDRTRLASPAKVGHSGYYHAPYNLFHNLNDSTCFYCNLSPHAQLFDAVASSVLGICLAKERLCYNSSFPDSCEMSSGDVINAIISNEFVGASGIFRIPTRHNVSSSQYGIWNIRTTSQTIEEPFSLIKSYKTKENIWLQVNPFIYRDGSAYPPSRLRLVDKRILRSSDIWIKFTSIASFLAILICFTLTAFVRIKQDCYIIQRSMPFFLHGMCVCSSAMFLVVIMHNFVNSPLYDDTIMKLTCRVKVAFRFAGYYFGLLLFFIKLCLLRTRMSSNHPFSGIPRYMVNTFGVINVVLCIVWIIFTPLTFHYHDIYFDEYDFATARYGTCHVSYHFTADYFWIIFCLTGMFSIYIFGVSYKMKKDLQENDDVSQSHLKAHNEAKDIILSIAFQSLFIILAFISTKVFDFPLYLDREILCFQILPALVASCNMWFAFHPIIQFRRFNPNDVSDNREGSAGSISIPSLLDLPMLGPVRDAS